MFCLKKVWKRTTKESSHKEHHDLRHALRNYIDILYSDPNPEALKEAYKELKSLMPDIEEKINLKVL